MEIGKLILQGKGYGSISPDGPNKISCLPFWKIRPRGTTSIQDREETVNAGSQHRRSHPWQGHVEETWRARLIRTRGTPWTCARSQCEESHLWQGHEEGSWHTQGMLRLQGPFWKFLSMYPNKNLLGFVLCFSTLQTFSGKSQFRALVFCIWKNVSIQKPLWWLSSLPAGLVQLRMWLFEASWQQEAQET